MTRGREKEEGIETIFNKHKEILKYGKRNN
jgi:hypothetical protein